MGEEGDLTCVLLPGTHDSLAASELWRRIGQDAPANLRAITDDAPVGLAPGQRLLPEPCTQRRPGRDLTEAMSALTPEGARRIGLGHGATMDFSGEEGATGTIPPDRAARSGLDCRALGDWHGQMQVTPATWYSGTPESEGFKQDAPGGALLVTLEGPAQVTPVETAQFRWMRPALDLLPGEDVAARLAGDLTRRTEVNRTLARLTDPADAAARAEALTDAQVAHQAAQAHPRDGQGVGGRRQGAIRPRPCPRAGRGAGSHGGGPS